MRLRSWVISVGLFLGINQNFAHAQFEPSIELSDLNGEDGFAIYGAEDNDNTGFSVSSAGDVNNDGLADILSGRSLYLQPEDPTTAWQKIDLGRNVDGNIIIYLGEERGVALIGQSLPRVYQYLATDETYENWEETEVARVKATDHNNGQGYRTAQIIEGGAEEVLYASLGGIYMLEADGMDNWPVSLIGPDALGMTPRSVMNSFTQIASCAASEAAMYSASHVDPATTLCLQLHQLTAPPFNIYTYPVCDLESSRSVSKLAST
mgnify:CR=1 FL=1